MHRHLGASENKSVLLVALATLIAAGCDKPESGDWTARTTRVGDTTIVHTLSGQVWPSAREAVVDLSIGSLDSSTTSFGQIAALAVNKDGDVFVYDWQVPVIRQFNKTGEFIRQVGAKGRGPGEYGTPILGLAVRLDGRLQLGDMSNNRITLYNPDGSHSTEWFVVPPGATPLSMMVDAQDHTFIRYFTGMLSATEFSTALAHIGPDGAVLDTLVEPVIKVAGASYGTPLRPAKITGITVNSEILVGANNRYEFDVLRKAGGVLRISRFKPPIHITDEEHAAYDEFRKWLVQVTASAALPVTGEVPRVKPFYRTLRTTTSGNIWVHLYTTGKKKPDYEPSPPGASPNSPFFEPTEFDVFDRDGRYLGPVHVPDGVTMMLVDDDVLWGWRIGSAGEPQVVRMHVVTRDSAGATK